MISFDEAKNLIKTSNYPFLVEDSEKYQSITVVKDLEAVSINNKLLILVYYKTDDSNIVLYLKKNEIGYRSSTLEDYDLDSFKELLDDLSNITYLSEKEYIWAAIEKRDRFISIARVTLSNDKNVVEEVDLEKKEYIYFFNKDNTLPILQINIDPSISKIGMYFYMKDAEDGFQDSKVEYIASNFLGLEDEEFLEICRSLLKYKEKTQAELLG